MFETHCPRCGCGDVRVIEVTMVATGAVLRMNVPLEADGFMFDVNDVDLEDHSTENEKVRCMGCKAEFSLGEMLID